MWGNDAPPKKSKHTFKRREATTQKQFQVAELSLTQYYRWEFFGLCSKFCMTWKVSCQEVSVPSQPPDLVPKRGGILLQLSSMRRVCHVCRMG